ncbi:MAG TPA: secretin N-terminal domain-containing protein [Burkholderiales bacterium]|nr:secretin N-terminal domain-containing protein [Burkholderiales bacterium]
MRTLFLVILLTGCATALDPALREARDHTAAGRGEQALAVLERARRENPERPEYRTEYFRVRDMLAAQWLAQAETLRSSGQPEAAATLYRRVQKYDADSARARAGLQQLDADARHRALVASAERLIKDERYPEAQDELRPVLVENPQQRDARRLQRQIDERTAKPAIVTPRLKTAPGPISLELRDVPLRAVFDTLSRNTGVSFVLDRDVRADQRTTIVLRNAQPDELVRLVLTTNQLEQKVVNESTLLVYPNTPAKQREYQELVVKSFYLANADVRQTANMVRALVKTRDLFVDEKLNLLVIKDTPAAVRLAERLIATHDLAEPEVMLEVEVLEIGSSRLLELGIRFPDSLALSLVGAAGIPGTVTLPEWLNRGSELVQLSFTNPLFLFQLRQQDGSTSVLANPRIRVKNKEKARVHIGDRVPVITTTAAATGGFVSESVSYLDVGLKLEVEPLVYLEDEVGIKVALEVSNIAREIRTVGSNTLTYQIGTRNASTVLRLRDGETQILAGLISDEERKTTDRVPGLGDVPYLGSLFSHKRDNAVKTEIVLLITPRLVRTLARPDARAAEFAAGTEASSGAPGIVLPPIPFQQAPATPTPQPPKPPSGADQVPFGGVRPPE